MEIAAIGFMLTPPLPVLARENASYFYITYTALYPIPFSSSQIAVEATRITRPSYRSARRLWVQTLAGRPRALDVCSAVIGVGRSYGMGE